MLAVAWQGPRLHGQNVLRRVLREHYLPSLPGGRPHLPLVSVNLCFTYHGGGGYLKKPTEKEVLALLRPCQELGVEAFVIDAGWYPCKQWGDIMTTRDFSTDMHKYPRGFRPLSEAFGKAGMAFGLWFPPEAFGSYADAAVRDRFVGIVRGYVKDQGITMYRQDAGMLPQESDPERQGATEMKHIAGLYAMQDQLRREFPLLLMEGCCGGAGTSTSNRYRGSSGTRSRTVGSKRCTIIAACTGRTCSFPAESSTCRPGQSTTSESGRASADSSAWRGIH